MSIRHITLSDVRVRTSEGEGFFYLIHGKGSKTKPIELHNDIPSRWVTFPAGTEFELAAKFEKTDTFMIAVTAKIDDEKEVSTRGIILRRMSYVKLLEALKPPVAKSVTDESNDGMSTEDSKKVSETNFNDLVGSTPEPDEVVQEDDNKNESEAA